MLTRYDVSVKYDGRIYSLQSELFRRHFSGIQTYNINNAEIVDKNNFKLPVYLLAKCETKDSLISLSLGHLFFVKKTTEEEPIQETYSFEEDFFEKITYNTDTDEGTCPLDIFERLTNANNSIILEPSSLREILCYIESVSLRNERVFKFLAENISYMSDSRFSASNISKNSLMYMLNLTRLVTTNLVEIEKVISSDNTFVLKSILNRQGGTLDKGKKLARVINIPKFALDYIKDKELTEAEEAVRGICSDYDGNDLKIIFDFFDSFDDYNKVRRLTKYEKSKVIQRRRHMLDYCYFLMQRDYKIVNLLNYVLRQEMYWNDDARDFQEPFEEMKLLVDYIGLNEKNNFPYEKYPQDLERSHDIAVKNFKELGNADKNTAFIQSIKDNYYTEPIVVDDFVFSVPKDINDLVTEGNNLHHCIGSYTDNIINNCSHIYFMRFKSSPDESYVTLELDPKTNALVEAKENYNKEVSDDEAIKVLKKFEKQMKSALASTKATKKTVKEED